MELIEKVRSFPHEPGVYRFYSKGRIVYIGKSKDLRSRVMSYFRDNQEREKIYVMMEFVDDVDCIILDTHLEARLLEYKLIRRHQPIYNAQFKMEKTSFYLNLDTKKLLSFSIEGQYGPFLGSRFLREFIKLMDNIYPIYFMDNAFKFDYNLLAKRLDKNQYKATYKSLKMMLESTDLLESFQASLESKMLKASKDFKFELAQKYKELIYYFDYIKETVIDKNNFLSHSFILKENEKYLLIYQGRLLMKDDAKDLKAFMAKAKKLIGSGIVPEDYNNEMKSICYSEFKDPNIEIWKL